MFELWFSKMPVLNKKGFFPGPEESLDSFLFRVQQIEKKYPPHENHCDDGFFDHFNTLFQCVPAWMPWRFDSPGLAFFQGACATVELQGKDEFHIDVQVHPRYQKNAKKRKEILSHEGVHIVRMAFADGLFEELLAYQSSRYIWRRWLGGVFLHPRNVYCLFGLILLSVAGQLLDVLFSPWNLDWGGIRWFFALLPLGYFSFLLLRGGVLFWTLRLAAYRVMQLAPKWKEAPLAVLLRMCDKDIFAFAWKRKKSLENKIELWKDSQQFYYQFLYKCFFSKW